MQNNFKIKSLVFINDSLGELDWISPFINKTSEKDYHFYIFLNLPGKDDFEKKRIFDQYFNKSSHIEYINNNIRIPKQLILLDRYINSLLRRAGAISFSILRFLRFLADKLRFLVSQLIFQKNNLCRFDIVFRDYNLKDSFALSYLMQANIDAKVCIFPHSTAIQSNNKNTKKNPPKKIKAHLFLENTDLSTHFSKSYKEIFLSSGSPQIETYVSNEDVLFDLNSKSILFITRNCDPRFFGLTYENAGKVFEDTLIWAKENNFKVYVKHHPRDSRLDFWRSIQKSYKNVYEIKKSLNNFIIPIEFSFCFYTSACLLLTARKVPVFDVSPYCGDVKKLPFHYHDSFGNITHELVEQKMCGQLSDLSDFLNNYNKNYLVEASKEQFEALIKNFPQNSFEIIDKSLKELFINENVLR